jgi:hypothetical protein
MVALVVLGGTEDFTPPIVGWIFAVNASALIGLFVLNWLAMVIGLIPKLPDNVNRAKNRTFGGITDHSVPFH